MSRTRYRWSLTRHCLEEIPEDAMDPRLQLNLDGHYEGTRATDGTDLSTRRRHQEYARIHGLAMAQDYQESWQKARANRDAFATGNQPLKPIREAVDRAWHLRNKP